MMKKNAFLLVFCFSTQITYGQFSVGTSGGLNLSGASFSELPSFYDPESKLNYYIGITPKQQITPKFAVLADFEYSVKGWEQDRPSYAPSPGFVNEKYQYTYLDINPEVEYKFFGKIGIGVGAYFGYLLDEKLKVGESDWQNIDDLIQKTDLGLTASVRAYFNKIYAIVSYNHGLKDVTNLSFSNIDGLSISREQRNKSLQIGIGYVFGS